MNHNFIVIGTNHKKSPLGIREKMSLTKNGITDALSLLREIKGIEGAVILSTCNRIEFYVSGKTDMVKDFIYEYYEMSYPELEPYLYTYTDIDAIRHLFYVASGLDSQIVGETQILGQVRNAYEMAKTDTLIDRIFTNAIQVGRRVRQETKISLGNVSIGSVAVDMIKEKNASLKGKKILIVGVGKVSSLVVKYLYKEKVDAVFVSNRTYEKALELAKEINGKAVRFDKLKEYIEHADIIISTTNCPHTILDKEDFKKYKKPLLIVDLAIPRDVSPDVKKLDGINLLCLDDLEEVIGENINKKKNAIPFAEGIIKEELEIFHTGLLELPSRV